MASRSFLRAGEHRLGDVDRDECAGGPHGAFEQREVPPGAAAYLHHPVPLFQSKSVNGPPPVRPIAKANGVGETRREVVRRDCPEETSVRVAAGLPHPWL